MVDQSLFIFNLNLVVDLRDQLLSKYKLEFDNFALCQILWFLAFYWYINYKIWISFDQFEDFLQSVHFRIFLIFDFQ